MCGPPPRLLAEEGPAALTTRRLAAEVGASTTAVYTHFGSKEEIVRAICAEGFARLARRLARVRHTEDPVADCANLGWAYRRNALANPHLYAVMFGAAMPEFTANGMPTLQVLVASVARCQEAGRFDGQDPWPHALTLWTAAHGVVALEQHGFFGGVGPFSATGSLRHAMCCAAIGFGDEPDRARASIARTRP
jgi:AcrR family transcriptional regulator